MGPPKVPRGGSGGGLVVRTRYPDIYPLPSLYVICFVGLSPARSRAPLRALGRDSDGDGGVFAAAEELGPVRPGHSTSMTMGTASPGVTPRGISTLVNGEFAIARGRSWEVPRSSLRGHWFSRRRSWPPLCPTTQLNANIRTNRPLTIKRFMPPLPTISIEDII